MKKKAITSTKAPAAIGPYSQAIRAGSYLFLSGQIAINPKTGELSTGDIKKQTTQVLENLKAVLGSAGASFKDVVKTTVYLSDMENYASMNKVYAKYMKEPYPARATVEVSRLPKNALVEIDCIAVIN